MKQAEHSNCKATFDIKRRMNNAKLFQNQKVLIPQLAPKKSMGKKYMQEQNIFKQKFEQPKKQHREIVMSEQFIRSSKLFRLLKQKMDRCDSMYIKQVNALHQQKMKLKEDIVELKSQNYQEKIELWELKNKLMELKTLYHDEEEESKRLAEPSYGEQEREMEEGDNQMQESQEQKENQENHGNANEQKIFNHNFYMNNFVSSQQQSKQQPNNFVEDKNHFSEILQQLMNLKAERNRIQRVFTQASNEMNEKQQKPNMFQQKQQDKANDLSHEN